MEGQANVSKALLDFTQKPKHLFPSLQFSPVEVEDCERLLVCDIPNLDASVPPLARLLNGKKTGTTVVPS